MSSNGEGSGKGNNIAPFESRKGTTARTLFAGVDPFAGVQEEKERTLDNALLKAFACSEDWKPISTPGHVNDRYHVFYLSALAADMAEVQKSFNRVMGALKLTAGMVRFSRENELSIQIPHTELQRAEPRAREILGQAAPPMHQANVKVSDASSPGNVVSIHGRAATDATDPLNEVVPIDNPSRWGSHAQAVGSSLERQMPKNNWANETRLIRALLGAQWKGDDAEDPAYGSSNEKHCVLDLAALGIDKEIFRLAKNVVWEKLSVEPYITPQTPDKVAVHIDAHKLDGLFRELKAMAVARQVVSPTDASPRTTR